jgi:hypothetical protein
VVTLVPRGVEGGEAHRGVRAENAEPEVHRQQIREPIAVRAVAVAVDAALDEDVAQLVHRYRAEHPGIGGLAVG